jgi:SAM-dependent methyltransferase
MTTPSASPEPIFRVAQGFMAAKYLFAANELGVFAALPAEGATLPALAEATQIPARTLRIVLDALVGLELLAAASGGSRGDGKTYRHTPATELFLSRRHPADISAFLKFWDRLSYRGWIEFSQSVRTGRVGFGGAAPSQEDLRVLMDGIEAITVGSALGLAEGYDFGAHERLLDLGGGAGAFVQEIARRWPKLRGTLFDLAPEAAARRFEAIGLTERFSVMEGDFFVDPLPDGHDVVLVSSVLHMYLPEQNVALLRRARGAVPEGARLLLLDFWLDESRSQPLFNALMAGEFLVVDGGDSYPRSAAEAWLAQSGWSFEGTVSLPGPASLILGRAS